MRSVLALFLVLAIVPLAGCGSAGEAGESEEWDGPPTPNARGALEVSDFNEFLDEYPEFAWAPTTAATLFLRLDQMTPADTTLETQTAGESETPVGVVVTLDGLADDSVRAQRYVLGFERQGENEWRLTSAVFSQRCQPGRGHQSFSPEACV
jgi:hypothetical protein